MNEYKKGYIQGIDAVKQIIDKMSEEYSYDIILDTLKLLKFKIEFFSLEYKYAQNEEYQNERI